MSFKIAGIGNVIDGTKCLRGIPQRGLYVGLGPDIEFSLFAFRIGVEAGGEGAAVNRHIAHQPGNGLVNACGKKWQPGLSPDAGHQADEKRIVIEHFLKMRHQPVSIDRVARKASANMVIYAALAHAGEGVDDIVLHFVIARVLALLPQKVVEKRLREFRSTLQAAAVLVHIAV